MESDPIDLRQTLSAARLGTQGAATGLLEVVYEPLRELALHYFRGQPASHTLQPTALVHEVFLKLAGGQDFVWQDQAHFFAVCARAMRSVLVDHARAKATEKRGGAFRRVPLEGAAELGEAPDLDVLDLEEHLELLARLSERQARVVECRVYSGMTIAEIAEVLHVSPRTVDDDWALARAWLRARLEGRS